MALFLFCAFSYAACFGAQQERRYSMIRRAFCVLCFAVAAALLLSGCGLLGVKVVNPSKEELMPSPASTSDQTTAPAVDPAPTPTPVLAPTPAPVSFSAVSMQLNTPYTFHETTFTFTAKMDEYDWPTTRLLAEEDNGWESAVTYNGAFASAYYCETQNGPCILITVDTGENGNRMTYVLDGSTLAEGDAKLGEVESLDGGIIHMASSVDVLGTYDATRDYTLGTYFALEPAGLFTITEEEDRFIVTSKNLPVQMNENGQYKNETLGAGTELCVTSTDAESVVYFKTRDNRTGRLAITIQEGWLVMIEGTQAEEWFAELPYAG